MISECKVLDEIGNMKEGDVLLLENVRTLEEEINDPYGAEYIKKLSDVADAFVLDTLSVSHREHASVVGFSKYLPSFVGPVLYDEIKALEKLEKGNDLVLVFGGSKLNDMYELLDAWIKKDNVKYILLGGKIGFEINKDNIKEKYGEYANKIILPVDGAVNIDNKRVESEVEGRETTYFKDIGTKTIELFKRYIISSKYLLMNGPMGMYENINFRVGTCELLKEIAAKNDQIFSVIGGGHTISAMGICKIDINKFGYVSLSGKALIKFIENKKLPGLSAIGYYSK